jgi:acyl-CoA thioesterase-1
VSISGIVREEAKRTRALTACALLAVLATVAATACGGGDAVKSPEAKAPRGEAVPVESITTSAVPAVETPAAPAIDRTGAPRVLFLGTSLTAGYGLDDPARDAYPAELQRLADSEKVQILIVNAGLSGETSAGALRRVDWLLRAKPAAVVIETGANDGLRGLNPDSTAANLKAIIGHIRAIAPQAKVALVQMEAPTNLGQQYTRDFHALYGRVAKAEKVPLFPFLLDKVAGIPKLNQNDGIHPTPAGAKIAAANLWPSVRVLITTK